jgi:hypothetical protein
MRLSTALLPLLASLPALVDAGMCVGWYDRQAAESVQKCCSSVSGEWTVISDKEAACLFPNKDIDDWTACAEPIMKNPDKRPYSLHAWQCSPCGDVCTVTGGPTLTATATKTPLPTSTAPPTKMYESRLIVLGKALLTQVYRYTPYPPVQEPVEEIR